MAYTRMSNELWTAETVIDIVIVTDMDMDMDDV